MAENDEKEDKKELPADPATYTADKVITTNANPPPPVDPSTARKRRKAIIESQRKETEEAALQQQQKELENEGNKTNKSTTSSVDENNGDGDDSESEGSMQPNGKKRRVKKTQIRYDPDVPMSKEQLAAWRREARRVRNRESAAASRQRIRSRITELETEVDEYKSKYHAALDRLKELEEMAKNNATNAAADGETVAASEGETTGVWRLGTPVVPRQMLCKISLFLSGQVKSRWWGVEEKLVTMLGIERQWDDIVRCGCSPIMYTCKKGFIVFIFSFHANYDAGKIYP